MAAHNRRPRLALLTLAPMAAFLRVARQERFPEPGQNPGMGIRYVDEVTAPVITLLKQAGAKE